MASVSIIYNSKTVLAKPLNEKIGSEDIFA